MIRATDCKCYECGEQAVALYPCIDPDIPQRPYCRKCLDKLKERIIMEIFKISSKR